MLTKSYIGFMGEQWILDNLIFLGEQREESKNLVATHRGNKVFVRANATNNTDLTTTIIGAVLANLIACYSVEHNTTWMYTQISGRLSHN
jgi:hypothetical protein